MGRNAVTPVFLLIFILRFIFVRNYFKPSEGMEIDLIYDNGQDIVPVEIKSGRHKRSISLKNYIDKYSPAYSIRISERNFGEVDGIRSIPLYAVWCM